MVEMHRLTRPVGWVVVEVLARINFSQHHLTRAKSKLSQSDWVAVVARMFHHRILIRRRPLMDKIRGSSHGPRSAVVQEEVPLSQEALLVAPAALAVVVEHTPEQVADR